MTRGMMSEGRAGSALRLGRDPNDATWIIVRYRSAWERAKLRGLIHDESRSALELEPESWSEGLAGEWLPLEPVADGAGYLYRSDRKGHVILRRHDCEAAFKPLACFGGHGWKTGTLDTPLGLAVDSRGLLYVADSGNHRVQVVRPEDGAVIAVLGQVDEWGRPVAGAEGGAMIEPVHAVPDPCTCRVYVADREGGLIHVFDRRFEHVVSFEPESRAPLCLSPRTPGVRPRPVAVAVAEDGTLLVLDTTWPRIMHMTWDGMPLPDLAVHAGGFAFQGGRPVRPKFKPTGDAVIGPLDGKTYDQKWHRVILETSAPAGTSIEVQTYAANVETLPVGAVPWAPDLPVAIPLAGVEAVEGEHRRLVLSDTTPGPATDRGRYLWIRLQLFGRLNRPGDAHAVVSPSVQSVRALMPRLSYLSYLPATFSRRDARNDPPGALFLERFLALFEGKLTDIETAYESVSSLLNPEAADGEWLAFLSSWLELVFDPSWPLAQRRQLVLEAAQLFKLRGTREGLLRYVEIYTGKRPELLEGFQNRPSSALVVGRMGRVGCSTLAGVSCDYEPYAHRFTLFVFLDDACALEKSEASVRSIVETTKPAHTTYELCYILPQAKVAMQSTVGIDFVLGETTRQNFILGLGESPLFSRPTPVVGLDAVPGSFTGRRASKGGDLSGPGIRIDGGFRL